MSAKAEIKPKSGIIRKGDRSKEEVRLSDAEKRCQVGGGGKVGQRSIPQTDRGTAL